MNHFLNSYQAAQFNHPIDYQKIGHSIEFYKMKGFSYVDIPWDTPEKYRNITFVGEDFNPIKEDRFLVGSAEQSFIYLFDNGYLKRGSYVACTPCFRGDDIDEYHQQYFLKVELFDSNDTSERRLIHIIETAKEYFNQYLSVNVIQTENLTFDIETLSGIELGSYGIREYRDKRWIYGTGLAEPRFSKALLSIN